MSGRSIYSGGPVEGTLLRPDQVLERLADAVVVISADGLVSYANRAVEELLGWRPAELLGRPLTVLVPPRLREAQASAVAGFQETGQSRFFGAPVRMNVLTRSGSELPVDLAINALGPRGAEGFVASLRPALSRADAEDHATAHFLAEAGTVLSSSLDYDATLGNVAGLAVPTLADWCAIDLLEDDKSVRRLAVTHTDPTKADLARAYHRFRPDPAGDNPVAQCLRTGRSALFADLGEAWLDATAADREHRDLLRAGGFVSEMVVPLVARGRTVGAMSLAMAESGRRYDRTDLRVAEELARRSAVAVDNARLHREARDSARRFEAIVEGVDAIFWEADADAMRSQFVSSRAEAMLGYPVAEWLGDPNFWPRQIHADDRDATVERDRAMAAAGEDYELEYRMVAADGRVVWVRDIVHIDTAGGGSPVLRGLMVDITDRKAAEEELRFQHTLLEAQAEASVEGILVVSPEGRILTFNRRFVDMWPIPDDVVASRSDEAAIASVLDKVVDPDGFRERIRKVYASPDAPSQTQVELRDGRVFDRHGAPLRAEDGTSYGYVWHFRDITEERRARQDLQETSERFARLARTLQESLLPPMLPAVPGADIATRYLPAGAHLEVGGDFYDLFRTGSDTWSVVIGDVCGKGAEAATVTALARYTLQAAAMQADQPHEVLGLLNEALLRRSDGERFVTAIYAVLRPRSGQLDLTLACGGHPLPLVVRRSGGVEPVGIPGMLIGAFAEAETTDASVILEPGDAMVLFTDGVVEAAAEDGTLFGDARLRTVLEACRGCGAEEIAARVEEAVVQHGSGAPHDDTALLVVRAREW